KLGLKLRLEVREVELPESLGNKVEYYEKQIRQQLDYGAGDLMPWDNTPTPGIGPRLGRPGPGTPFEQLPGGSKLRKLGYRMNDKGIWVPPDGFTAPVASGPRIPAEKDVRALLDNAGYSVKTAARNEEVSE